MPEKRTIFFRGQSCPVLADRDGLVLVDGPRGQELSRRRAMARLRVFTETFGGALGGTVGDCVEYEGVVLMVTAAEMAGECSAYATLEEIAGPGEAEAPEAFERFMARLELRITQSEHWGYCWVPVLA